MKMPQRFCCALQCAPAIVSVLSLFTLAVSGAELVVNPAQPNTISFTPQNASQVQFVIHASRGGQACIDELEVYGPDGARNLALAKNGAKASASSCLAGYAIHQVANLNDGLYGNSHSWIAAGTGKERVQIELPAPAAVAKVVFSRDREGQYRDRLPADIEIRLSTDGRQWKTVARVTTPGVAADVPSVPFPDAPNWDALLRYALLCERSTWLRLPADDHLSPLRTERPALPGGEPYWGRMARLGPVERVLVQMEEMAGRLAAKGIAVDVEREQVVELRRRYAAMVGVPNHAPEAEESLYLDARLAKRRLMFRDPELAPLQKILFVKRHPYRSSHNYSDILDSQFRPGGGVCVLEIPRSQGRLEPSAAKVKTLFDAAGGIARDVVTDFDAAKLYFAYRPDQKQAGGKETYWHVMTMNVDGTANQQLTDGPFHDYYPCPLPDGGLSFISTRCRSRFLCWRPQAFVLFRMDASGQEIRPLSFANLSEWSPTVMRDGRILWTRSEYVDKGADFGHTLWAIQPDGTHPELVFGNNTPNCYMNGREIPGTSEILCTLISHGGDHNGPIGLIDLTRGPFDAAAITNITPDSRPHYNMNWAQKECFRDPAPVTRDYFLVSHAPADRFGIYVIDRYGNRELLYLDPEIASMNPTPLRPSSRPPVSGDDSPALASQEMGQFFVADVYQGLEPQVARGRVKHIRVCQEIRADLERLPDGAFRKDHGPVFEDFYATPVHKVGGPGGWPSYIAKASLGLAPVESDGSASFYAPSGRVLYFQVLDENYNELQRMRSVIQLQPGERRSCIGCHENRRSAPPARAALAGLREPSKLQPPPWGAGPFGYERVVQPVWNARCVACHDARKPNGIDLSATLDAERVPASYRGLIGGGWVSYFDYRWNLRHSKAEPLTFGTLKSRIWKVLDAGHHDVKLTGDEVHAVKCWIDLNCPLWPDYRYRPDRPGQAVSKIDQ